MDKFLYYLVNDVLVPQFFLGFVLFYVFRLKLFPWMAAKLDSFIDNRRKQSYMNFIKLHHYVERRLGNGHKPLRQSACTDGSCATTLSDIAL